MKKLFLAITMTAMVALGLVATTGSPASAACPYSACINTTTTVSAPHVRGAHRGVPISVTVTAPGNTTPTGTVNVRVTSNKTGKVKFNSTQPYAGGTVTFVTAGLHKGNYSVLATYTPTAGSVWNGSTGTTGFHIKRHPHHHHHH